MEKAFPINGRNVPLTAPAEALLERYRWQVLFALVLVAAIVRLAALGDFLDSIYGDFLIWDERVYHRWASALVDGSQTFRPVQDFTPLPAYVMAAVYSLFSPSPIYFRYFNILLGISTCILIYLIGREISGRLVATGAGFAAALYKPFIFFSITILKTSLSVFLFACMALVFIRCIKNNSYSKAFLLGICAGLATNVRANIVLLLPLLPALICWRPSINGQFAQYLRCTKNYILGISTICLRQNFSRALISTKFSELWTNNSSQRCRVDRHNKSAIWIVGTYFAGLAIALSPFVVKNYSETGYPALTATGGFNLYLANNPDNPCPYYRPVPFASSDPSLQGIQFVIEASRRTGKKLTNREASSFWVQEVFRLAIKDPAQFLKKLFQKALVLFNRFEPADNFDIGFLSRFIPFLALPFLGIGLMIPLGMAGIIRAMADRDPLAISLFLISIVYGATLVVFFTNIRIRLPLLVVWIPYSVSGIIAFIDGFFLRRIRLMVLLLGTAILFSIITCLPLPCTYDMSGHYNTHAINLMGKGREKEAIAYWKESADMKKPYSAYANLALAGYYSRRGFREKTLESLGKIPENSFAASQKYERLADLLHPFDIVGSIKAYEKSLKINSGRLKPRKNLFRILKNRDPKKAALELRKLIYISSFYVQK